jgi:predicted nucleic-acid-binding Zn-ribbon protein
MSDIKKCPKCGGGTFIEGFLPGAPHWKAGRSMLGKTYRVFAYKCTDCGYVEFYVKSQEKERFL